MNLLNISGHVLGYPLGILTGTISFFRRARMFHPVGTLVKARVKNLIPEEVRFPDYALMRFSSAWWKNKEWIDVLGVSMRFGESITSEIPGKKDQDLLFASLKHPWQLPFGPLMTKFHNFFENTYYAVSPFVLKDRLVYFKLTTNHAVTVNDSRTMILKENILSQARMILWIKKVHEAWEPLADITLLHELNMNQEKLRFNPFLNGLNIKPYGFVHHLRIGAYRLSQFGRSLRHGI